MSTPVTTLALLAVAQHAADHGLALDAVDAPRHTGDPIQIRIFAEHFEAWLDTVTNLQVEERRPVSSQPGSQVLTHRATVPSPIGDVAVELWTVVLAPSGLRLLGSAS
ncbi:hypothetical protein GON03_19250 [Nocardioides sp. MAH-18]|uniref:Uncharacterized protein n=1 Tax=Nocardioides agri TaxID=2682843 RepID=A0A6L6XX08_9ACTN|nr:MULTISPECIES: hypothetical protein [unclassified Nocardioides]MBA2952156.1 hypothetical protein [Nocardioides sp. CGMCC 1.13656]MVQ51322.1 hypothetical protein [Nocardioides sp. MAH-18]